MANFKKQLVTGKQFTTDIFFLEMSLPFLTFDIAVFPIIFHINILIAR